MRFLPEFSLGLFNGWLPFVLYVLGFGITIFSFSKEVRARLYDRSLWTRKQKRLTKTGKLFSLFNMILFIISPIKINQWGFSIGILLYCLGFAGLIIALFNYKNTPLGEPVVKGLYKYSRNPQIVGIWILFAGICLMIGSYFMIIIFIGSLIFLHNSILAEEDSCRQQYGKDYEDYLIKVPRYFGIVKRSKAV